PPCRARLGSPQPPGRLCARVARPARRVEADSVSCSAPSDPRLARSFLAAQLARSAEPDPGCPGVACFGLVRCGLGWIAGAPRRCPRSDCVRHLACFGLTPWQLPPATQPY